jgi:hypothetical protein
VVWRLRRTRRDVVAVRADHDLAVAEVPVAAVGTVAMAEVAAAPSIPEVPHHERDERDDVSFVPN